MVTLSDHVHDFLCVMMGELFLSNKINYFSYFVTLLKPDFNHHLEIYVQLRSDRLTYVKHPTVIIKSCVIVLPMECSFGFSASFICDMFENWNTPRVIMYDYCILDWNLELFNELHLPFKRCLDHCLLYSSDSLISYGKHG